MKYELVTFEIKKYIKDNPDDNDNAEDMFNNICNKFRIEDDEALDQIWKYIRSETNLPK